MGGQKEQGGARQGFDVADAAPLLLDPHGLVAGWTVHAERLLGHGAAEAVGRKFADLLEAEDAERMEDLLARCRTGADWTGLMTALHRDGQPVPVSVRVAPTTAPQGRPAVLVLLSELGGGARGWDMSRGVLEQIVAGNPIGIAIVDTELRFVWSNAALEQWGGGPGRSRVGLRVADVQPGMDSEAVEERMRHVLETGEQVIDYEYVGRVRSAPLRETAQMLSFTRLEDDRGDPMGVYYTVVDVTDRHRARERLALLDRAGRYIGRTLDVMTTAQELADVAVPGLADFVTVDLLETVLRGAEPVPEPLAGSERMPLRRAGHRSLYEDLPRTAVDSGAVVSYLAGSPPVRCLATGRSWRQEQLDPLAVEWAGDAPDGRESTFLELGLQSVMIVPIRARGVTLGLTTFFRRRQSPFDADDLHLAEDLVSRAAVCVDNARRYTRERDAALVLQRSLLPRRLPDQDAVEVAACYRPADELTGLGGDWYDLIPLSAPGSRWWSARCRGTASTPPRPWGGCARRSARSPRSTCRPRRCWRTWTTWLSARPGTTRAGRRTTTGRARSGTAARSAPCACTWCTTRRTGGARWPPPGIRRRRWSRRTARSASWICRRGPPSGWAVRRSRRWSCRWTRAARWCCTRTGCWRTATAARRRRDGSGCVGPWRARSASFGPAARRWSTPLSRLVRRTTWRC